MQVESIYYVVTTVKLSRGPGKDLYYSGDHVDLFQRSRKEYYINNIYMDKNLVHTKSSSSINHG